MFEFLGLVKFPKLYDDQHRRVQQILPELFNNMNHGDTIVGIGSGCVPQRDIHMLGMNPHNIKSTPLLVHYDAIRCDAMILTIGLVAYVHSKVGEWSPHRT